VGAKGEKAWTEGVPETLSVIGEELASTKRFDCAVKKAVFASFVNAVEGIVVTVLAIVDTRKFEMYPLRFRAF
jgi:hypothetical protein